MICRRHLGAAGIGVAAALLAGCGGSSSPAPGAPGGPGPVSTPTPAATPTPAPTPTPCTQGLCEEPVTNTAPAVTCTMRLYWVKRPGSNETLSSCSETDIPLGWQFALDTTCRDKDKKPTNSTSQTYYRWDGTDRLLDCNNHGPFQLWCRGLESGHFQSQLVVKNSDNSETRAFWFHGDLVPEAESKCGK